MIRVEKGSEVSPGIFEYVVPSLDIRGRSHQPLSDACRQILRAGGDPKDEIGTFREGRSAADLTTQVGIGAGLSVSEPSKGKVRFGKYQPFRISEPA